MTDELKSEPELLPCPFCGVKPEIRNGMISHPYAPQQEGACVLAGMGISLVHSKWGTPQHSAWNTRTPSPDWQPMDSARWERFGRKDGLILGPPQSVVQEWGLETGVLTEVPGGFDPDQHIDVTGASEPRDPFYQISELTHPSDKPDPVSEAARVLMESKMARDMAFDAMWDIATDTYQLQEVSDGERYAICGDAINAIWYAALRALSEREDG